jgi:hypothetical protein
MRVQTLGGLSLMPRSFAPDVFRGSTGIAVPGMSKYVPSNVRGRGVNGLGEAGLSESIGLLSLGAIVGGALGFVVGAGLIAYAARPSRRW